MCVPYSFVFTRVPLSTHTHTHTHMCGCRLFRVAQLCVVWCGSLCVFVCVVCDNSNTVCVLSYFMKSLLKSMSRYVLCTNTSGPVEFTTHHTKQNQHTTLQYTTPNTAPNHSTLHNHTTLHTRSEANDEEQCDPEEVTAPRHEHTL